MPASGIVHSVAQLPQIAHSGGALVVEINPVETVLSDTVQVKLRGSAAEVLPLLLGEGQSRDA